ncbi:hypothetical protein BOTCAL_0287g00130 [Botryotinia calthae]|uniref:Uncharacterized protein n=1 Tax=Botryotinia calthae TaxID=38488 RepID=A0A4Y8CV05_9HELO|nr:hypothetical protein BOTCAL_0287g00130 [Botryotinia calthae]
MASKEVSSVSFSIRRADLVSSILRLPDCGEGIDETTNGLTEAQVTTILERRNYLQAQSVISQTRYLLDNLTVFRHVFVRKTSDPDFDSFNTIACKLSTLKAQNPMKERHIYLDELMGCNFFVGSDGYEAIKRLEPATIIFNLQHWHTWLSRRIFPNLPKDKLQIALSVANAFGAEFPLLEVAGQERGLQMQTDNTGDSWKKNHKKVSGKRKRSI